MDNIGALDPHKVHDRYHEDAVLQRGEDRKRDGATVSSEQDAFVGMSGTVYWPTGNTVSRSAEWQSVHGRLIRMFDILLSLAALIVCLPLFIIFPILIKLDSKGSAFFTQERLGHRGVPFRIIKFRTMRQSEHDGGWAVKNDDRITRIGKVLRRFHLDEIPQFVNIFRGELSLVGPRPYRSEMHQYLCGFNPEFSCRLEFKPGLTGWAQLLGRNDQSVDDHLHRFSYDKLYGVNPLTVQSYWEILLKTVLYFFKSTRETY